MSDLAAKAVELACLYGAIAAAVLGIELLAILLDKLDEWRAHAKRR
jgi:hypothetical protein